MQHHFKWRVCPLDTSMPTEDGSATFKAAIINISMDNRSHDYFYMKGVTRTNETTDDYNPMLQLSSSLQRHIICIFRFFLLFWVTTVICSHALMSQNCITSLILPLQAPILKSAVCSDWSARTGLSWEHFLACTDDFYREYHQSEHFKTKTFTATHWRENMRALNVKAS